MRNVEIPRIYDSNTGQWLIIGSITYNNDNEIIKVEHWDGNEYVLYEKGEFVIDEENVLPLYQNI